MARDPNDDRGAADTRLAASVRASTRLRDGRDYDTRRREVLRGAAEVFYQHGFARGTLTEIAGRVGITQPGIYHYVSSKDDLLIEIMWQVARDLSGALERALATATDPVERLRALVTELTGAIIDNRQTFAVYWKELYTIPDEVRMELRRDERTFVDGVESLVVAAQQAGALPPEQPSWVLAEGILGMLSWVYQWYRPDGPLDATGIATAFNRLLGLADAPGAPR